MGYFQYRLFTIEKYNNTIRRLSLMPRYVLIALIIFMTLSSFFVYIIIIRIHIYNNNLRLITLLWLIPMPFIIINFLYFLRLPGEDFRIHRVIGSCRPVIFQITTLGFNYKSVIETVKSVDYWYNKLLSEHRIEFESEIWVVIEPDGYKKNKRYFSEIEKMARFIVVPEDYKTLNKTTGKARALQYACDIRKRDAWIYHQDEETMVGEDTILGIDEFIKTHKTGVGVGIILYPQNFNGRPSQMQELSRSYMDIMSIFSQRSERNMLVGFHGSHIIVSSDIEDSIGWDFGNRSTAEDLNFENAVRRRYKNVFYLLKGFAYEKAALCKMDQLRQRRRWIRGIMESILRKDISRIRKTVMIFQLISWFSAALSLFLFVLVIIYKFSIIIPELAFLSPFIWFLMLIQYYSGYSMHRQYIKKLSVYVLIKNGLIGAFVDMISPWYAILRLKYTPKKDFIKKDV
ncbi:glycosyltransferase family 2 protein [Picrophilus oshimae]|uniref:Hypothetical membrane spanning protein n=1 Tax=Picrophilus torridus (strain ATCC 700027 / DSM 9790 / JCM 10055 / NBRC 100828 / KAW 2/3) TaxID=1122961 RepID=Q6L2V0_PICTO|nr:glycosyltransferase family 2 protein [Picrophilus oshimae]AAT42702.1 hypothetical membrane spanning protein [Picrophilus oshimae DSM 9789]